MQARRLTPDELVQAFDLRYRVLRQPHGEMKGSEQDEYDLVVEPEVLQVGVFAEDQLVGIARANTIRPQVARVRYMAVEPDWRGRGVGRQALELVEEELANSGFAIIELQARQNAAGFYRTMGYSDIGEAPELFGVQHRHMRKEI